MKIVKTILFGIAAVIALVAVVGFMLPSTYKVERSLVINAPADVVFEQVNDLQKNANWSPWDDEDPTMKVTYGTTTVGVGASSSWESEKSGSGTMTIEESVPAQKIVLNLDFHGMGGGKAHWTFTPEGEGTKVTEDMTGDQGKNPFKHVMNLMMDKFIGPYFERGLASLKTVSEKVAADQKAEQAATQQAAATPADEAAPAASAAAPAAPAAAPVEAAKKP